MQSDDEREDISVPSSEDENEDKDTDTEYCAESAENLSIIWTFFR